ncbi:helix-turn-helix domain-containing protein [Streptomyces sp. NPDC059985]|uniref:helix-turn-helix domain-containing protein n=1 Tax=Streptomyces sp. NPDC059985 TaxID=3347025 RepID=UPI0036C12C5E
MSVALSTAPLSAPARAEYRRSVVSDTFVPLDVAPHEREPSAATITSWSLGPVRVSRVEAGPRTVSRERRLIARGGAEYVTVTLQQRGTAELIQDGHRALVEPGNFTCSDAGRPYRREQPEAFVLTAFRVPKDCPGVSDADLRAITGTVFGGRDPGTSGLVAAYLARLATGVAGFDPCTGGRLALTTGDLLAVVVRERQGLLNPQASEVARGTLARVKEHILGRLADPALSPERIAAAHHISVRYLHKIFRSEGVTVSRWIRRERLERCRRELSRRTGTRRTVAAIAQGWGFVNPSHFSRAFRAAYGMSPRQWQASASGGGAGATARTSA